MQQKERILRVVGPIIGFILLYYVVTSAAGYLQQGQLKLAAAAEAEEAAIALQEGMAAEAAAATAPVTASSAVTDTAAAATAPVAEGSAVTETVAATATELLTATAEITGTVAVTSTAGVPVTAALTSTDVITGTQSTAPIEPGQTATTTDAAATITATTVAAAPAPTTTVAAPATPTTAPTATAAAPATPTAAPAAAPAAPAASVASVAAVNMDQVAAAVTKGGCGACHVMPGVPNAVGQVGPDMSNIGVDAATRVPGQTAEQYIRDSILNPNAFTAPNCPFGACITGTMPANINVMLSPEEIDTIINYLVTLKKSS
jgi:hypothetical protein